MIIHLYCRLPYCVEGPLDMGIEELVDPTLLPQAKSKAKIPGTQNKGHEEQEQLLLDFSKGKAEAGLQVNPSKPSGKASGWRPPKDVEYSHKIDSIISKVQQKAPAKLVEKSLKKNPVRLPGVYSTKGRALLPLMQNAIIEPTIVYNARKSEETSKPPAVTSKDKENKTATSSKVVNKVVIAFKERAFNYGEEKQSASKETINLPKMVVLPLVKEKVSFQVPDVSVPVKSVPLELPPLLVQSLPSRKTSNVAVEIGDTDHDEVGLFERPRTRSKTTDEQFIRRMSEVIPTNTVEQLYRDMYKGLGQHHPNFELKQIPEHISTKETNIAWLDLKVRLQEQHKRLQGLPHGDETDQDSSAKRHHKRREPLLVFSDLFKTVHVDTELTMEQYINPYAENLDYSSLDKKQARIVEALRNQNIKEAAKLIDDEISADYGSDWAFWFRHIVHLQQGFSNNAYLDISTLSDRHPASFSLALVKARLQAASGNEKGSIPTYSLVSRLRPEHSIGYVERAKIFERSANLKDALELYKKAFELDPKNSFVIRRLAYVCFQLKLYKSMIDYMDLYLAENDGTPSDYYTRGICQTHHSQFDEAYKDYMIAIKLDPFDPVAFKLRGMLLRKRNPLKAIDDLTVALLLENTREKSTDDAKILFYRGCCYMDIKNYECAIADFEKSFEANPTESKAALRNLILLNYLQFSNFQKAMELVEIYLKYHTNDINMQILKSQLLLKMASPRFIKARNERDNFDLAIGALTKAIHINPSNPFLHILKSHIHQLISERNEFTRNLKRALVLTEKDGRHINQHGLIHLILGDFKGCINALSDQQIKLNEFGMILLGRAFKHAGDLQKAFDIIYHVPVFHPERDFFYGLSLYDDHRYHDALPYLKRSLMLQKYYEESLLFGANCKLAKGWREGLKDLKITLTSRYRAVRLQTLISMAIFYEHRNLPQKAFNIYNQVLVEFPFSQRALMLRGLLEFRRGNFESSLRDLNDIRRISGRSLEINLYYKSICKHKLGDYKGAIEAYSAMILQDFCLNLAYRNRGIAYWAQGKPQYAWPDLMEASKYYPNSDELVLFLVSVLQALGKNDKCIEVLTEFLKRHPDDVSVLMTRGNVYSLIADYSSAAIDYAAITSFKPKLLEGHLKLIFTFRISKQYENALNHAELCIKRFARCAELFSTKGVTLMKMNAYEEALDSFNKAIAIDPKHNEALVNRGIVYQALGSPALAVQDYKACIRGDPQNVAALFNSGSLYLTHGQWEFALKTFDSLVKFKDDGDIRLSRGIAKCLLNDFAGAEIDMKKAIAFIPESYAAHFNLAQLYDKMKEYEDSVNEYQICIGLMPEKQTELNEAISSLVLRYDLNSVASYDAKLTLLKSHFSKLSH